MILLRSSLRFFGRNTAAALMIGDELLNGTTLDTNSHFLASFLDRQGVQLSEIRTISDSIPTISRHLTELRTGGSFDYIFTSGGIGSTHDDVTYEAVADTFGVDLCLHEETAQRILDYVPEERINDAMMKMAHLPVGGECYFVDNYFCPILQMDNSLFVLPGIPYMFELMLNRVGELELIHDPSGRTYSREVFTRLGETRWAEEVEELAKEYATRGISIGSYPRMVRVGSGESHGEDLHTYSVKIVVKSSGEGHREDVEECVGMVREVCQGWFEEEWEEMMEED